VPLAARASTVIVTDFSPDMIALLRKRLAAANITNVDCEVMDGQALSVKDGRFDRAASVCSALR
jgi:ubiquinone/menaquinone biosynthesis C-methylase UbiE